MLNHAESPCSDDPANPQSFSSSKKIYISFILNLYTFSVNIGSSIYVPREQRVMDRFRVGPTTASLGISLYVLACMFKSRTPGSIQLTIKQDGLGPMLWSLLSEYDDLSLPLHADY